jgi:hypothetical protein
MARGGERICFLPLGFRFSTVCGGGGAEESNGVREGCVWCVVRLGLGTLRHTRPRSQASRPLIKASRLIMPVMPLLCCSLWTASRVALGGSLACGPGHAACGPCGARQACHAGVARDHGMSFLFLNNIVVNFI